MSTYIFILGNNPPLSITELQARYPDAKFEVAEDNFVTLTTDTTIDQNEFNHLGGSIKSVEIIGELKKEGLINALSDILSQYYQGKKLDYGLSIYGFSEKQLRSILLNLKKELKKNDIKARFINNNFKNISSAQYKSISRSGVELVIVKSNNKYLIGKVVGVQDIDAYSQRDYEKPFRDMQMGMMPPKLAQILINLTESKGVIWDPFCGSGTIVMEGLLMGRNMIGSDIDPKRVEGAKKNVNWLKKEFSIKCDTDLFVHDATKPIKKRFDAIAFEGDLGIPHNQFIKPDILQGIIYELDELYVDFFRNIKQIKCRVPIVCALPFFRLQNGKEIFLDKTIREIENMGFVNTVETRLIASLLKNTKPLQYSRPDQAVGRAIYKLKLNI